VTRAVDSAVRADRDALVSERARGARGTEEGGEKSGEDDGETLLVERPQCSDLCFFPCRLFLVCLRRGIQLGASVVPPERILTTARRLF